MAVTTSGDVALAAQILAAGGISAAGRRMGLSPASVSAKLTDLERRLGVALFARSTRVLRLTTEGKLYLAAASPVLDMLEAAEDAARAAAAGPDQASGVVRLAAPTDVGRLHIAEMVSWFIAEHPRLEVELSLSDTLARMGTADFDLAVRYGEIDDITSLTSTSLAPNHRLICGAPAYFDRVGRPSQASDLQNHNCMCLRTASARIDRWPVGRSWVAVTGDRAADDGGVLRLWALGGSGLVLKSFWDVASDLAAGRLERAFPDLPATRHPFRLIWPGGRRAPTRVRLLADHLKASFKRLMTSPIREDGRGVAAED